MKPICRPLLLAAFLFSILPVFGQKPVHVPGQILVSLGPGIHPESILLRYRLDHIPDNPVQSYKKIADLLNTWLLELAPAARQEREIITWMNRQPEVRFAQYNHILEERGGPPPNAVPNDPLFPQQWQYMNTGTGGGVINADLDADLAWNITTGGLTPRGDTIVVAIIDGGMQDSHEDLAANMWRNRHEIPMDGIDNDGNGYTDDYRGWNVFSNSDNISGQATGHGTPVSAIVGAKGNNSIGVSGVNWDVKMMFVAGNSDEATILAAYDYVLKARKRYNATNGQQGALVVAVNCSWGITYGQPAEAPLWCAAFDSLGAAGILGIAATANDPLDIDEVGDLPTACPSDFLVAVTNLTKTDLKASMAAWGDTTIDLGAYGEYVFTAGTGNSYGDTYKGTSFAAPHVSGAIGLLYSAPCTNLIDMARADPAAAALWAKSLLLNFVSPNSSLMGKTVTGGRLNLNELIQGYQNQCVGCMAPFSIAVQAVSATQATFTWSKSADVQSVNLRWRKAGDLTWNLEPMVAAPATISGLSPCTDYEIQARSACGGSLISTWTPTFNFRTDGCCSPPNSINATSINDSGVLLAWNQILAGNGGYLVRIKTGNNDWEEHPAGSNSLALDGLAACTEYEVIIKTLCSNENSPWSLKYTFRTGGCGACTEKAYCTSDGGFAFDEWIAGVGIDSWSNVSGGIVNYQDFTTASLSNPLVLLPGSKPSVTLTPGYSGLAYKEYFRIYIDYNADGDFDDADELAFDPGFSTDSQLTGEIIVPNFSTFGFTRMRVQMKFIGPQGTPPLPCEEFDYGQVEDYCAHLGPMVIETNSPTFQANALKVFPQPAADQLWLQWPDGLSDNAVQVTVWDAAGRLISRRQEVVGDSSLIGISTAEWPSGMYLISMEHGPAAYQQKVLIIR